MVLTSHRGKNKPKPIKEALACATSKMAVKAMAEQHTASPARSRLTDTDDEADAGFNLNGS